MSELTMRLRGTLPLTAAEQFKLNEEAADRIEEIEEFIKGDGRCTKCFEYNEQKRCACERQDA